MLKQFKVFISVLVIIFFACPVFSQEAKSEEVKIVRDNYGVPHIYAVTDEGLMFGQGYAMAGDRLFQMEMCRLSASGEMAKYLGSDYLEYDRLNIRYFPTGEALARFGNNIDETQKKLFKAFADGVNYRIKEVMVDKEAKLPKEFAAHGLTPQEWTFLDVIKIAMDRHKYVFDGDEEILNASLLALLKEKYGTIDGSLMFDTIAMLNDPLAGSVSGKTPDSKFVAGALKSVQNEIALNKKVSSKFSVPYGIGSYAVLLTPKKSETGNSILLAGPQSGFTSPSFFYECGLHSKNIQAYGIQSIGLPGLSIAQNQDGAWCVTGGLDNQLDYYVEVLNPSDKTKYWHGDKWLPMIKETYMIDIKGGKTEFYDTYKTIHGPVIFTDSSNEKYPVAYSKKCALSPEDLVSSWINMFNVLKAKSSLDFIKAVKDYPISTNFFYISRSDKPVYFHAGKYPVRAENIDPRLPSDGKGTAEWSGFLPFEKLILKRDTPRGYFADWNSKPELSWNNGEKSIYWGAQNRVDHVKNFIDTPVGRKFEFKDMNTIDSKFANSDIYASDLKELLIKAVENSTDQDVKTAVECLKAWDNEYTSMPDGCYKYPGLSVFQTWLGFFGEAICPELKGEYSRYAMNSYGAPLFYRVLSGSQMPYDFLKGRNLSDICESTLKKAVDELKNLYGVEPTTWRMKVNYTNFIQTAPTPFGKNADKSLHEPFFAGNRASALFIWEANRFWMKGVSIVPPGQGYYSQGSNLPAYTDHRDDQLPLYLTRRYKMALFAEEDILHQAEDIRTINYENL